MSNVPPNEVQDQGSPIGIEGVINIDKPVRMTSHDVVQQVRRISGIRRVGHAGTLDPLATGVLLVCLGRATRLIEYLVGQNKVYDAVIRLGQETDTFDADGALVKERSVAHVTADRLTAALSNFQGTIQQRPPMYSALKKDGKPLYKLARKGIEVERPLREVTIYDLDLIGWESPDLRLNVVCSAGTYIRSLAHDLGQHLDCGGHIIALRRTAIGIFDLNNALHLNELNKSNLPVYLQSPDAAVSHLPRLDLSNSEAARLLHGQAILYQPYHPYASLARGYNPANQFIGIIKFKQQSWQPGKIFHPDTRGLGKY